MMSCPAWPRNFKDTLKNNRALLAYYVKLCASFQNPISEFNLELQSRNVQFESKSANFCPAWPRNLKGDLEKIGHLIYAILSFAHHFIAFCDLKLELQSRNAQFGSKLAIFLPCVTLKFDRWPKNNRTHLLWYCKLCTSFCSHYGPTPVYKPTAIMTGDCQSKKVWTTYL